jgi:hypothetical protein
LEQRLFELAQTGQRSVDLATGIEIQSAVVLRRIDQALSSGPAGP